MAMVTASVLNHFDEDLPVEIHLDASGYVVGVVILQHDEERSERVVAYGAAMLNAAQRNYSTTERECLAIFYTCKKFRYYILGQPITVYSNHQSLCWLYNV